MVKWIPAGLGKHGLRYREHETLTRGGGRSKRPLRYYSAIFKWKGKQVADMYGWENEYKGGIHEIESIALELKMNRKARTPPFTNKERQVMLEQKLKAEEDAVTSQAEEMELATRLQFGNLFDEYIGSKPGTQYIREAKGFYEKWLEADLKSKRLDEIKLLDLQRIQKRMEKAGRAKRTVKTIKEVVRSVYNYAIEHELYEGVKPTDRFLKGLTLNNNREAYYTVEQIDQLLEALRPRSEQVYQMVLIAINTGMRYGEIAKLRWQHVNKSHGTIYIADPKNEQSRTIPMLGPVKELFESMTNGKPNDLIFPNEKGTVQNKLSHTFRRTIKDLGFNDGITDRRLLLGFHSLRHTTASWLARDGVEISLRAKILGHKTLEMQNRYTHLGDKEVEDAMAAVGKKLSQKKVVRLRKQAQE